MPASKNKIDICCDCSTIFAVPADVVTDALMSFDEVEKVAVIGLAAKALSKEFPRADLLAHAEHGMLYRRGEGRLRSAVDLPSVGARHDRDYA